MKQEKTIGMLFYVAAVVFNTTAIVMFAGGNSSNTGFIWLCLGSSFLCLGTVFSRKRKVPEKEEKQE